MQEWNSVLFALLAIVGLLAFVCLLMSIFVQINEDGLDDVLNELEDRCEKENNKMINSIDEAIAHCHEKAKKLKQKAKDRPNHINSFSQSIPMSGDEVDYCLECAREHEQLASWLEELKERREADRWIPVSERLPKEANRAYLVTVDYGNGIISSCQRFFFNEDIGWNDDCVIAWKPLPEPYKESEATNETVN